MVSMKFSQTTNTRLVSIGILLLLVFLTIGPAFGSFRKAPDIRLYSLNGQTFQLNSTNKPVVVFFLSPQCMSCLPDLAELKLMNESNLIDVIPICPGCNWREVRQLNDSFSLDLEIFMGKIDLKPEWGVWSYPTLFLVNYNMRIVDKWEDTLDLGLIAKQIEQIKNTPFSHNRTRTTPTSSPSCSEIVCY